MHATLPHERGPMVNIIIDFQIFYSLCLWSARQTIAVVYCKIQIMSYMLMLLWWQWLHMKFMFTFLPMNFNTINSQEVELVIFIYLFVYFTAFANASFQKCAKTVLQCSPLWCHIRHQHFNNTSMLAAAKKRHWLVFPTSTRSIIYFSSKNACIN